MRLFRILFGRMGLLALMVLVEIFWLYSLFQYLEPYYTQIEIVLRIIGIFIVLSIINKSTHLSFDMIWIIAILLMPVAGTLIYYIFSAMNKVLSKTYRGILAEEKRAKQYYQQDPSILSEVLEEAQEDESQIHYISRSAGFPVFRNQGIQYFGLGEEAYKVMLEDLKKAEKFIFIEYFIIEPGQMWNGIMTILKKKAQEGVDVRVMYDDLGSMNTLPLNYVNILEGLKIKAVAFNRMSPLVNGVMNHRDHRKIMVIDGKVAYSGGINLADEYINRIVRFGHWKDNCIRVLGDAAWSYTTMFLTMWNALRHEDDDYKTFQVKNDFPIQKGWVAPYGETPLDDQIVGQNVYMNILNQARKYCYIVSPYLIIDTEMINTLILTAQRGVDVRIITPGIPDKKIVWNITRSYYRQLIEGGVKIYEYTPGFNHEKIFVSDDEVATVGTINLDYRSLYLHFENGTYLYRVPEIMDVKKDFLETIEKSHQMTIEESTFNLVHRLIYGFVKIFAPMM